MPQDETDGCLIEYRQAYADGIRVLKKGLDATPLVIRKYGLGSAEVMAFTSWEGRRRALTAFHFHPDFPDTSRRAYMDRHDEGHQLALGVEAGAKAAREARRAPWRARAGGLVAGALQVVGAIAIGLIHGNLR